MSRRKFLRSKWRAHSKLGKGRKKKQKWRKPKGRDTKMRLKKKGNPKTVSVGYKKQKKAEEKKTEVVRNISEFLNVKKGGKVILARIGKKKKIEILKKAKEKGIDILNVNIKKFLERVESEKQKKEEIKAKRKEKEEGKKKEEKGKGEKKKEEAGKDKKEKGENKEKKK